MTPSRTSRREDDSSSDSSLSHVLLTSSHAHSSRGDCIIPAEDEILFKNFIKQLPAAVGIFDRDMRYIIVSDTYLAVTGIKDPDVLGKRLYDVVPDIPQKWRDVHKRGVKGEHLSAEEDIFMRADGTSEWWKWELIPWYKTPDTIGGIILYVEDITERKAMEKKMDEIIRTLNRSNKDLERFAHICAHDLNEPLRTIGNYCHILQHDFGDILPPAAEDHFTRILRSVKQMSALINGILVYSQVGERALKKEFCSLQAIAKSVILLLDAKIREKKAHIDYENLPHVYGDKILLTQVLQNLISNSLKFNKSEAPMVRVIAKEKKRGWLISVEDNGIGIEARHHKIIFDLFKRLHGKADYEGTGIGLSFCKKIIEAHGGAIKVKSSLNQGACFSFFLPKPQI